MPRAPRDAAEITAERLAEAQEACLLRIAAELAEYGIDRIPQPIRKAVRDLATACERIGEHHVGIRVTHPGTPPDADRAPRRRADWDDMPTPTVTAQERARRR